MGLNPDTPARGAGPDPGDRLNLAEEEALLAARAEARRDTETALRVAHDDATIVRQIELPVNHAWVAMARHQPQAALRMPAPAETGQASAARASEAAALTMWAQADKDLPLARAARLSGGG